MDNTIDTIKKDAVTLVSDVDAAITKAETWAEKVLTGGIEARVLGNFASEVIAALKAVKAEVDAIAQRLGATDLTTSQPSAQPTAPTTAAQ